MAFEISSKTINKKNLFSDFKMNKTVKEKGQGLRVWKLENIGAETDEWHDS